MRVLWGGDDLASVINYELYGLACGFFGGGWLVLTSIMRIIEEIESFR